MDRGNDHSDDRLIAKSHVFARAYLLLQLRASTCGMQRDPVLDVTRLLPNKFNERSCVNITYLRLDISLPRDHLFKLRGYSRSKGLFQIYIRNGELMVLVQTKKK